MKFRDDLKLGQEQDHQIPYEYKTVSTNVIGSFVLTSL